MKKVILLLLVVLAGLPGCGDKQGPSEVTHAFWQAVIANDQTAVNKLIVPGTMKDASALDNSEHSVTAVSVTEAVETGDHATVATTLTGKPDASGKPAMLVLDTVLLESESGWKVDGNATINNLIAQSVNSMVSDVAQNLEQIGTQMSQSLSSGLQAFMSEMNKSLPQMKEGLNKLQDSNAAQDIGQNLGKLFATGMQQIMGDLNQGLEQLSSELEAEAQLQSTEPAAAKP